jgi:hypothetical protein
LGAIGVAVTLSMACASAALANGGATIASAPVVVSGQQEFGNTTDGIMPYGGCAGSGQTDFWKLQLTAGDTVVIDWESATGSAGRLDILTTGTTDFNVDQSDVLDTFDIGVNNKAESTFTAEQTGVYPIDFNVGCGGLFPAGPYDFIANVTHQVVLGVPSLRSLPVGRSAIRIGVHTPDGRAISGLPLAVTLTGRWGGASHLLGQAVPQTGLAVIHFRLPSTLARTSVRLTVAAHGSGYRPASLTKATSVR